jgi:hypothetical protein
MRVKAYKEREIAELSQLLLLFTIRPKCFGGLSGQPLVDERNREVRGEVIGSGMKCRAW